MASLARDLTLLANLFGLSGQRFDPCGQLIGPSGQPFGLSGQPFGPYCQRFDPSSQPIGLRGQLIGLSARDLALLPRIGLEFSANTLITKYHRVTHFLFIIFTEI